MNFDGRRVSCGLPHQGFLFKSFLGADAPVEALTGTRGEFDFGPVEPGTVLGGVVEFEGVPQVAGRFDGQLFIKGAVGVGALVVLHELDFLCVGVVGLHEPVHKRGVIGLVFGGRDL